MSETREIRQAIRQLKGAAKEDRAIQRAFEDGQTAQLAGEPMASCRFKLPARRNAWERGWLDAERKRAEHESIKTMSEAEKAATREKLSAIKAMIRK